MKAGRISSLTGALCLGLTLGGCATTQQGGLPASEHERAPASKRHDGPNAGAQLGAGCAYVAIGMAGGTGGVGVPISIGIAAVCLPVAVGLGVLHAAAPHLGLGASAVPDTGPVALRALTTAERSVFPQSSASGCVWGSDCYSYKSADAGPTEMRKLYGYERSVFPNRFQAGCATYGYC